MDNYKSRMINGLVFGGVLPVAGGFMIASLFPGWKWLQLPFHSAIETLGLFAGITLALLLLLQRRQTEDTAHYSCIASALLGMGILDGFHSSVSPGNVFVWLHSTAILAGGAFFAMIWVAGRTVPAKETDTLPWFAATAAVIFGTYSVVFPENLPLMLDGDRFSSAAVSLNVFGGGLFISGALPFLARYRRNGATGELCFACFCLLNGSSGLLFPFSQPWLADWWLWHILRLIAYLVLLVLMFNIFRALIDQQISEAANVLASSVSEILTLTTQLATVSMETASSVNETTATVEEVKQAAQLSADKSRSVSENAQQSNVVAEQGRTAVTETIEGIHRIKELMKIVVESVVVLSEQTQAIGEIIKVVNDLAQQSNLLAVNAAIEASKAGEQGKGFTIVAQEIKSLADQSKQETQQIRAILADIQKATGKSVLAAEQVSKAVEDGVKQAAGSGESITKLADNMGESARAAAQIAASSQQQLAGMEQVAMAMVNIKQSAQQNVSGTKQAEQAAHILNDLGQKLKEMVGKYKV